MDYKFDYWISFIICVLAIIVTALMTSIFVHEAGVNQALERVCVQTNGKYDFCQEVTIKKYKVAIPDPCMEKGLKNELSEEEWQNCFGTPIFDMNKRNKK